MLQVPLVPWLPALSILVNTFLTMKLSWQTWVRFSIWLAVGLILYASYGWRNSSEEYRMKGQVRETRFLRLLLTIVPGASQ